MSEHIIIKKCPICGKEFVHNPMSVYKIIFNNSKTSKTKWYCGYTCWRKAGGGIDNSKKSLKEKEKIKKELLGKVKFR